MVVDNQTAQHYIHPMPTACTATLPALFSTDADTFLLTARGHLFHVAAHADTMPDGHLPCLVADEAVEQAVEVEWTSLDPDADAALLDAVEEAERLSATMPRNQA